MVTISGDEADRLLVQTAQELTNRLNVYLKGQMVDTDAGEITCNLYALGMNPDYLTLDKREREKQRESARVTLLKLEQAGVLERLPQLKRCPTYERLVTTWRTLCCYSHLKER